MAHASVSELRSDLAKWIRLVKSPSEYVIVHSRGHEVAALIPYDAMKLLWSAQDERRVGPINPATGRPFGPGWVGQHFNGHYDRERDPEGHLHPSREEAPWLGAPFAWPPEVTAPEVRGAAPAPARRWWQVWRR